MLECYFKCSFSSSGAECHSKGRGADKEYQYRFKKQDAKTDKSDAKTAGFSEEAAVYEKSDSKDDSKDTAKSTVNQKMSKADRDALVQALKDDANARQQQLIEIVRKSMTGQASTWDKSQGLKSLFENLTVDADTIAQAKRTSQMMDTGELRRLQTVFLTLQRHCREATRTRLMSF